MIQKFQKNSIFQKVCGKKTVLIRSICFLHWCDRTIKSTSSYFTRAGCLILDFSYSSFETIEIFKSQFCKTVNCWGVASFDPHWFLGTKTGLPHLWWFCMFHSPSCFDNFSESAILRVKIVVFLGNKITFFFHSS